MGASPGNQKFLAHSRNDGGLGVEESLPQHVLPVCERAVSYASLLGLDHDARMAALLHDLGKFSTRFLARLQGKLPGLDHSSAGARAAIEHSGAAARAVALAIEGHHVGIPRGSGTVDDHRGRLDGRLEHELSTGADWRSMVRHSHSEGIAPPRRGDFQTAITWTPGTGRDDAAEMLDVRLLFSTLVDADFIETEAHFAGDAETPRRYRRDGPRLEAAEALGRVLKMAEERRRDAQATSNLIALRETLRGACLRAAELPVGLFTLTAPTGAGKTLAMLAFALAHAVRHPHVQRIVMIIPYLTIIDQTARICRELFSGIGPLVILEDHSASRTREALPDNEDPSARQQRLLAENWDAPIVLTTSLNALESLHDNGPRRCRKLHHLANSVLLFDEVQTLPPHLAELTLASLSRLSYRFRTSIVFSTATQPAFEALDSSGGVRELCAAGWTPREIVGDDADRQRLFDLAKDRYSVTWRLEEPIGWDALAIELVEQSAHAPVIAIVNLKRHATALVQAVKKTPFNGPLFHLSTNLCPQHRERVLVEIFSLLNDKRPMILVATQCIEAGVDISAPVMYRALAPLESIAQAAGRCNRHGTDPQLGRVITFVPEDDVYPPGAYETAARHTRSFIAELRKVDGVDPDLHNILSDPALLHRYYRQLYQSGIHESHKRDELLRATKERDFPEVARLYRLIDQDTINLLVPYDRKTFRTLMKQVQEEGKLTREWIAQARQIAVGVRRPQPDDDAWGSLRPLPNGTLAHETDWFAPAEQAVNTIYDPGLLGLTELRRNWFAEPV